MLTKKEAQQKSFQLFADDNDSFTIKYAGYCPSDIENSDFYCSHDIWRGYERESYYLVVWVKRKAPEFKIIHKIDPWNGSLISETKYFLDRKVANFENLNELVVKSWTDGLVGSLVEWDNLQKQLHKRANLTPISTRLNNYLKNALSGTEKEIDTVYSAQRLHATSDVLTFPAWLCTSTNEYNLNPFVQDNGCIYKIYGAKGYELNSYEDEILLAPNNCFKVLSAAQKTITKCGGLWGDEEWDVNITEYELQMF
jgi:hypothetical protein